MLVCTSFVYTGFVSTLKNVTLSAPEDNIERARMRARLENTTLNEAFRQWLERYGGKKPTGAEFRTVMAKLRHVDSGGKFTRDEMNERGTSAK